MHVIDQLPIWLVFGIFVAGAFACVEGGYHLGQRRKVAGDSEPENAVGAMVASTLALLAFVLSFTFGIATARFEDRRSAVLDEANAIGTTYLRADFLDEPGKSHVKKLLRRYVELRVNQNPGAIGEIISQSELLQNEIWSEAVEAGKAHPTPISALFVNSLNEMIDIHSKRVTAGLHARVPGVVWLCLLLVSSLAMSGIGFLCGLLGHRSFYGTAILVLAFGLVMLLVADLERPMQGTIRTPQQPMTDLYKKIGPP